MRKLLYIVICCSSNGDEYYHIDSVWTSMKKAEKRRDELNQDTDKLYEEQGYGPYNIETQWLSV